MNGSKAKPCPVCNRPLAPDAQSCSGCNKFDPHGLYVGRFKIALLIFGFLFFLTYLDKTGVISFVELWKKFAQ